MKKTFFIPLALAATVASADPGPSLFFTKADLPALRERVKQPTHASEWARILGRAQAYCDPKSGDYTDPEKIFTPPAKSKYVSQHRHDAILPHHVGRTLTTRMEALGLAYQFTGEKKLGRHGAKILVGMCKDYPATHPAIAKRFAGGRGDIMYGLAMGLDMLSDCLTPEERAIVAPACRDYLDVFVREFNDPKVWWYKVHNFNGVCGGAAGCLALTLREDYPEKSRAWLAEARKIVEMWLSNGFDADGAGLEGVGYAAYGLGHSTVFGDALRRNGMESFFDHPLYKHFPVFLAMSKLPGEGAFDARNDSHYRGFTPPILKLAEATGNGLYRWLWDNAGAGRGYLSILWDNDVEPVSPAEAGVSQGMHFRGRGLCIWRTGWGKGEIMFSTEAGPYYPVTHNQADKGHFTLYGLGYRWATDPGYANEHEKEGRGQAMAHSCVLIDGAGQALSGAGHGTNGKILAFRGGPETGYALVDAKEAYNENNKGIKGSGARRALRHNLFVYPHEGAPAYAVVLDDIEKDDAKHEFTWQMMISSGQDVDIDGSKAVLSPFAASGHAFIGTPWTDPQDADESVKPGAKGPGTCKIAFDVSEPGEYAIWARVRTRAPERGKSDSFFIRVDDGEEVDWHMPGSSTWKWGRVAKGVPHDPFVLSLKPGKRLVTVRRREPGAEMDCLVLLPAGADTPSLKVAQASPLFAEAEAGTCEAPMRVERTEPAAARLELHLDAAAPLTLGTDIFNPQDYHGPAAFPRLRASTQAVNPEFAAVLLPLPNGTASPTVSFDTDSKGRRIVIDWADGKGRDEILWPSAEPRKPVLSQLR